MRCASSFSSLCVRSWFVMDARTRGKLACYVAFNLLAPLSSLPDQSYMIRSVTLITQLRSDHMSLKKPKTRVVRTTRCCAYKYKSLLEFSREV